LKSNPWHDCFRFLWSDRELDDLIKIPAKPVTLGERSADFDAATLLSAMKRIFTPSSQIRDLIRKIVALGDSYASLNYADQNWILRVMNDPDARADEPPPTTCLTGLAGCGKSALLSALKRLFDQVVCADLPGMHGIELRRCWFLSLKNGSSMRNLLGPNLGRKSEHHPGQSDGLANGGQNRANMPRDNGDLLGLARRVTWRDGVCMMFGDEFQFTNQGDANARVTKILLQLRGIGPPFLYCCNYSLGHLLKRRRQEDRDRLLTQPLFLEPEQVSTLDWKNYLRELKKTAPKVFTFNVDEVEVEIHQLTFGIRRAVIALLVAAYEIARRRGKHPEVGILDIRKAYKSAKYTVHREDIEILFKQQITGSKVREDLWCPFDRRLEPNTIAAATVAIEKNQRDIEEEILNQYDTKEVRSKAPRKVATASPNLGKNTIRFRGTKSLKQELLDGADEFDAL